MLEKIKEFVKRILGIDIEKNQYLLEAGKFRNTQKTQKEAKRENFKIEIDAKDFTKAVDYIEELIQDLGVSNDEIFSIIDEARQETKERNQNGVDKEGNSYKETLNGTTVVVVNNMAGGIINTQSNTRNNVTVNRSNQMDEDLKGEDDQKKSQDREYDNDVKIKENRLKDILENLDEKQTEELRLRVNNGIISVGDNCRNTVRGKDGTIVSKGKNNTNTIIGGR